MTSAPPGMLENFDDSPRPGGTRRFLIALFCVVGVLVGVVVGIWFWIESTSRVDYNGPEQLKYPEHRPYR